MDTINSPTIQSKLKNAPKGSILLLISALFALISNIINSIIFDISWLNYIHIIAISIIAITFILKTQKFITVATLGILSLLVFIDFYLIPDILLLTTYVCLLLMLISNIEKYKKIFMIILTISACLAIVDEFVFFIIFLIDEVLPNLHVDIFLSFLIYRFSYYVSAFAEFIGFIMLSHWLVAPKKKRIIKNVKNANINSTQAYQTNGSEYYISMGKNICLLLFTFGIWGLIWIYRTTKFTNLVTDEVPRNPTNQLLLCFFVPYYTIYWTYKTALRIDKLAKNKNINSDLATICLILSIFVGIVPPILMQEKINNILEANESEISIETNKINETNELKVSEMLIKYKELLDNGIITQEEFDAKKKQMLGL